MTTRTQKYKYDYYEISMPANMCQTGQEFCEQAIREAEDRARLDCTPCDWTAIFLSDEELIGGFDEVICKVTRRRPNTKKRDT